MYIFPYNEFLLVDMRQKKKRNKKIIYTNKMTKMMTENFIFYNR